MKAAVRRQVKFRVSPELGGRVKKYCAAHNVTQDALMHRALEQCLAGADSQTLLMRRLDLLSQELRRMGVGVEALGEAVGTFVQLWLAHNPEIGGREKSAAQRDSARRYRFFVDHVVRGIGDGRTLLSQLTGAPQALTDSEALDAARASMQKSAAQSRDQLESETDAS